MRILVTGANGQLGWDVTHLLTRTGHRVFGYGRDLLDVSDMDATTRVMRQVWPEAVVHAAAYTAVDAAESEIDEAFRVNADGSRNIAVAAEDVGAKVCYISTDYVFDGSLDRPYREFDPTGSITRPISVYGQSKLAGEVLTKTFSSRCFIVRTSWVFGSGGSNFVKTMLAMGKRGDPLRVISDQYGSPTYTVDLARFIADLIQTDKYGVYHASGAGSCTWYEFANAIFEEARQPVTVTPCTTEEFPRPAPRPQNSVLNHVAIRTNGFQDLPHWRDGLRRFLLER